MAQLEVLEHTFGALLARLSPASRRTLTREMAKRLRHSQQQRIRAQQNPDGSHYAPRAPQMRNKHGRIKRQMFSKLRTAKYLKASSSADSAIVEFTASVQGIARVHQYGLRDQIRRHGPEVQYPARELLGISDEDAELIEMMVIEVLADLRL